MLATFFIQIVPTWNKKTSNKRFKKYSAYIIKKMSGDIVVNIHKLNDDGKFLKQIK